MNILVLSVLVCAASAYSSPFNEDPKPPAFCNGLECPLFKSQYEKRCYQEYKWASTNVAGYEYEEAVKMGFLRLFSYIEGANKKSAHIPMTAPVRVELQPTQGPFCKDNFTINFFVPFAQQANPIAPTAKDVYISSMPAMCTFVKTFPGFASGTDIVGNATALAKALIKDGLGDAYHKEYYYFAGYDSPFRVLDRHNEIWFVMK